MSRKVVLAGACRTAIGKMGGALSNVPAADLGAVVIKEALNRAGVKPEQVDEETSKVTLSNFVLTGENAKNYTVSNKSFETTIANESLITVSVTAENGTVTGNGTYVKGSEVTLTAQPKSGYRLDGWYIGSI